MNTRPMLAEPEHCDNCASLNIAIETYRNAPADSWPMIWRCDDCGSFVGCHPNTQRPLGKMANARTRHLRAKAHEAFDPIWKEYRLLPRELAYSWLARQLGISPNDCHFALLDQKQLQMAILHAATYVAENLHKADKRQKKRHDQKRRAIQFERDAINRRRGKR